MFARTERLLLRPGWPEDAPALAKAIGDEAIVRNLAAAPWPYDLAEAEAFLDGTRAPSEINLLVLRRTHGAPQLIGGVGIGPGPDGNIKLGYWISRRHWGLGYATEAAAAVVAIARDTLRLDRLSASHFLDNPASGRVLEKLGFEPTGKIASLFSAGRNSASPARTYLLSLTQRHAVSAHRIPEEPAMLAA